MTTGPADCKTPLTDTGRINAKRQTHTRFVMKFSPKLHSYLKETLGSEITGATPIGGGCINDAFQVTMTNHQSLFVKQNRYSLRDMFEKEARGLELLAGAADGLRIPRVYGTFNDASEDKAYLILSFVREGRSDNTFDEQFGRSLAHMHQQTSTQYGLDHDNYIGRLPQKNDRRDDWITFFAECRIEPQIAMARDSGYFPGSVRQSLDRMYSRLPELLPEEPPSLLHGDLWGGNYLCDTENRPVLIDPAVYYGHREAELSFTRMFGGFGKGFYRGYEEVWPLQPGFSKRRDIFNLYPVLVHVNLFGGAYVAQAESIIHRF